MDEPKIVSAYYRWRSKYYRIKRIWFPSPAELRFIHLMGGKFINLRIKDRQTGHQLTIILTLGKALKSERVRREVRVGKYFVDFGNDIGRAIEIDGHHWHTDVVAEFDRDAYLLSRNWRIKHLPVAALWREPDKVQREALEFLIN